MRQRLWALTGVVLLLLVAGSRIEAEEAIADADQLELALKAGGATLPRFYLRDGRSIIGRYIGSKDGSIVIRRPSGGLGSIKVADIERLEIVDKDGKRLIGSPVALADGTVRLALDDPAAAETTVGRQTKSGGPLIKLPAKDAEDASTFESTALNADDGETIEEDQVRDIVITQERQTAALSPVESDEAAVGLPAPLRLSVTKQTVSEAQKVMYFQLRLSEPAPQTVVVIYTILNGSATADVDYKHRQGVVVLEPGQRQAALAVEIIDDDDIEDSETFKLFITADPSAVTIATRTAEATIRDND